MKKADIVKNKVKFLIIPILIILAGIVFFFVHNGFNFDIEFMGGIRMQVDMAQEFNNKEVAQTIKDKTGVDVVVQKTGGNTQAIIKTPPLEEAKKTEIYSALKEKYNLQADAPMSTSSATASFGRQVQQKTLLYTLIAILLILVYIAIRFEWRSAIMAVIALTINILVMFSVYSIAYVPLNTTFIAAMLTVVGYSINNTIVVFDRIRENTKTAKGRSMLDVTNDSIWQSMGRTINTTITTLITILLLYIIGVESIKQFAFPLIVGVLAGAYSSIFIASPFWATWKESDRLAKIEEARLNAAAKKKKK